MIDSVTELQKIAQNMLDVEKISRKIVEAADSWLLATDICKLPDVPIKSMGFFRSCLANVCERFLFRAADVPALFTNSIDVLVSFLYNSI